MSTGIYLDHIGIAVRDLAQARADYERLGFMTTPLSLHASPPSPGAAVAPSGSGNHCVMLEAGYIELLGVVGPGRANSAQRMLDRFEGAHILAFGSRDAAASREAIAGRGIAIAAPVALERDAAWGPEGRETRRAAFANAHLDAAGFPEAHAFVIEHRTPEVVWQAHQLVHRNGAIGLLEAWICADDPGAVAGRYGMLAGTGCEPGADGDWVVPLQRGRLRVMGGDGFAARTGGAVPPAVPGLAGLVVEVRDVAVVESVLRDGGVAFRGDARGVLLTGAETHGAALSFAAEA